VATSSARARRGVRINAWPLGLLLIALLVGQLPHVLGMCCAPSGATGLGTVWFINDFAQYESALNQGASSASWLIYDRFTAEPHAPAFMFPLYVGLGKLAALLGLRAELLERTTEVVARALLALALWRFCQAFASTALAARWAVVLALFGGGFQAVAAVLGHAYTGNWSYETSTFGLLFAAPHAPLAMAATLELARLSLRPNAEIAPRPVLWCAALGAAIAMLHPFHAPVVLGAALLTGAVFWRTQQGSGSLAQAVAAALGAAPVMLYSASTFAFDPFWSATYSAQNVLPSPAPHALIVDFGPVLLLALCGGLFLRARVAPFGLLVWLLLALVAMYLPVPFQRRLGFGLQPMLAVVAANTLIWACAALTERRTVALRLATVATAASGTALVLASIAASSLTNAPLAVYRSTTDLDAAAAWLSERALANEVIVSDWDVMNYLAPRTPARTFGGHPVATLSASEKQLAVASMFSHTDSAALARRLGAHWLVYGPAPTAVESPGRPAFQSGPVRVYRLTSE